MARLLPAVIFVAGLLFLDFARTYSAAGYWDSNRQASQFETLEYFSDASRNAAQENSAKPAELGNGFCDPFQYSGLLQTGSTHCASCSPDYFENLSSVIVIFFGQRDDTDSLLVPSMIYLLHMNATRSFEQRPWHAEAPGIVRTVITGSGAEHRAPCLHSRPGCDGA